MTVSQAASELGQTMCAAEVAAIVAVANTQADPDAWITAYVREYRAQWMHWFLRH